MKEEALMQWVQPSNIRNFQCISVDLANRRHRDPPKKISKSVTVSMYIEVSEWAFTSRTQHVISHFRNSGN